MLIVLIVDSLKHLIEILLDNITSLLTEPGKEKLKQAIIIEDVAVLDGEHVRQGEVDWVFGVQVDRE